MKDRIKTKSQRSIFNNGLALTAGISLTLTSYTFSKNLTIDELLFYALILIVITLTGLVISYFAYQRLRNVFELPMDFILMAYGVTTVEISFLLLRGLIYFHIPYGYLLLPAAVEVVGAIVLLAVVRILRSESKGAVKMGLVAGMIAISSIALFLIK